MEFQKIVEQRIYRKLRKKKRKCSSKPSNSYFDSTGTVRSFYTKFVEILHRNDFINVKYVRENIEVPKYFSFKLDYTGSVDFFKSVLSSYFLSKSKITLDFSSCEHSSIANFTLLDILISNFEEIKMMYNYCRYTPCKRKYEVVHSLHDIKTNKYLHSFMKLQLPEKQNDGSYYLKLNLQKGKLRDYKDNPKGKTSAAIVDFINKSTNEIGWELNIRGRRAIEGLMGEVLGNAEDHSAPNSYWYVDAISFVENQHGIDVVDLNLSIVNVGPSMYEGFENNKIINSQNYKTCQSLYELHKKQFKPWHCFERESLFTMYLLDDGISRLKFEDESRGNGTMKFLESFISLGSFGEENSNFKCQLNVISGHTVLTCDNEMHSFKDGETSVLSLNKEKDFRKLPDKSYLSYHKGYFPGTILECHIYLNKSFFDVKIRT